MPKEFYAAFDLRVLDAPTRKERTEVERRLAGDPSLVAAWADFTGGFEKTKRIISRPTEYVGKQAGGQSSGAISDVWQVFAERGGTLVRREGFVGFVLPSAFHANQSATGLRQLYLEKMALRYCFSFENRKKLFDIHRSFKFAAVVAQNDPTGTNEFRCGFYWHDLERLFDRQTRLRYSGEFVRQTGGAYRSLLELRTEEDAAVAERMYRETTLMGEILQRDRIRCGEEIHMSKGAHYFTAIGGVLDGNADPREPLVAACLLARGYLPLHEGKTFHQYDDRWEAPPRYVVALDALAYKVAWLHAARYYRLAFRDIASSTNERTGIFSLLPPGVVCGNKAPCEREPGKRPTTNSLSLLGVANTHAFDFALRLKVQATVNLFILSGCPYPKIDAREQCLLAHSALRLTCNHAGYAPLWTEQLGDAWREPTPNHTWPVLAGDDARWAVRAAIDALVADAYGLDRSQYAHVLSTFSHKSYPKAPDLCLLAFDELKSIGLDAFTKRHDPYWDIPLNEDLPKPVIDLPIPAGQEPAQPSLGPLFDGLDPVPAAELPTPRPAPRIRAATDDGAYEPILRLLDARGLIGSADAQQATGLDAAGVRPHLARLVEEGRAVTEGQRRGMKYRRIDP